MLLPQFSIRWMLLFTAVLAVLFLAVRQALLGVEWAIAVTALLALALSAFVLFGLAFLAAFGLARFTQSINPPKSAENPFVVEGQYPPQEVPKNPFGPEAN